MNQLPFKSAPDSLCILRLSAIGDICHTLAVVRAIQDHWPQTKLTWIIGKLEQQLIGDIEGIEFIVYNKSSGREGRHELADKLKDRHFDALLHMQVSIRSSLVARHIPAAIKLGFDRKRARDFQWLFTNQKIDAKSNQHVMDALFGFAEKLGVPRPEDKQIRWDIPHSDEDRTTVKTLAPNSNYIVISPCSSQRARNFRNWPAERYIEVINHAAQHLGLQTVLTGGPTELERSYADEIMAACPGATDLIGKTSLKELSIILEGATAVISPDSGPAHIANCHRRPVIGLYATSNPLRTGPYFSRNTHVASAYDLAMDEAGENIQHARWGKRVRTPEAMLLITTESVIKKLKNITDATNG